MDTLYRFYLEYAAEYSVVEEFMRVCKMGLQSIWIDYAVGRVRLCSWASYYLGNLTENTIEELWNGKKAEEFRKSMLDGSYKFCNNKKCPYLANNTLESILVEYIVPKYPKYCSLSYEQACNYVCQFCRKDRYIPEKGEAKKIEHIEKEVSKFINKLEILSSNGVGELFCSPSIMNTLSNLRNRDLKIELESNGSLFNEINWKKIDNLGNHNLTVNITVHSFNEKTYQFLSGTTLPMDNIISNLYFIRRLREKNIINHFELATVVCERNFREMPEFIKYSLEKFDPDAIRLRFFEPYGVREQAIEWFFDIRNSHHPYYDEFVDVMKDPVFNHPKVWKWQGQSMSDLTIHPYFDEQKKVKVLYDLITMKKMAEKIEKYIRYHQINNFALYGNGYVGQAFANILYQRGIKFGDIFDSYIETKIDVKGHEVIQPSEKNIGNYELIIVTSVSYTEIKKKLLDLKYKGNIISLEKFISQINSSY